MPDVCLYDILVVDPNANFNPNDCNPLNQTFAYVSLSEIPKTSPYIKNIQPAWIIGKNSDWYNNAILDATNKDWQKFFLNQIITPLWNQGYRGFFLDNTDSYFLATHEKKLQEKQVAGLVQLIQQIKQRYPTAKLILNRGFTLIPETHTLIDAVVIESLYHGWYQAKKAYAETSNNEKTQLWEEIKKIRAYNLPIIVIDYLAPKEQQKAQELSTQLSAQGFIPFITDKHLKHIYLKNTSNKLEILPRKILVLYTDENKLPVRFVAPLRFIGPILEYMGYIPKYMQLDKAKDLDLANLKNQYAGIILWLGEQDSKNLWLLDWVQKQIAANIPVVFLNSFGVPVETKALKKLGITFGTFKNSIENLKITKNDSKFIGYEIKPSTTPYDFYTIHTDSNQVLLQLTNIYQQTEDAVAITNWGGYAYSPFVLEFLPDSYALWVINPFEFFHKALRLEDFPIPDTTTENGRRLMSVHIDGDGFAYHAKWIGGGFAGEELRERILKRFKIPTSVSVITGEIAPNGIHPQQSKQLMSIARNIFALNWVESASHSFSHPFHWQEALHKPKDLTGVEPFSIEIPNYKFNMQSEITGSVDFINQYLLPKDKKCQLFFWSGAADPSVKTLKILNKDSLLNINGVNDTFIDQHHPSITGIRPMGMELGGIYQIFAPIDMDFYYMNSLAGPLYGFEHVIQTLKLTDKPRRFKPIDLYFHMYSASYPAALEAIIKVYQWALKEPVMNIFISDYIKKVLDYYQITIAKYKNSWLIYTKGDLRELRIDKKFGYPDLIHSHNVTGFSENNNDIYIHLGPNRLSLLSFQKEKPHEAYLISANARVVKFSRDLKTYNLSFKGYMPVQFILANVSHCSIVSKSPLKIIQNSDNTTSYNSSKEYVEIHINC